MRILVDTHTFLWWVTDDPKLSPGARRLILRAAEVYLSVVSAWEIVLKAGRGGLSIAGDVDAFIREQVRENEFMALPLTLEHVLGTTRLPKLHADPFDRLLVAQAAAEKLPIVTRDRMLSQYPVRTRW